MRVVPPRRTRVLFVVWRLTRGGGVPVVMRGLLRHADRGTLDLHVCTVRPISDEDGIDDLGPGVTYHPLGLSGARNRILLGRAMFRIARLARMLRPDILHVHGGTAFLGLVAAITGGWRRAVLEVHDAPQSGRMSTANRRLERWLVRARGFCPLVHSTAVRRDSAAALGLPEQSVALVPLGVELPVGAPSELDRRAARESLGLRSDRTVVVYVARIVAEKRPLLFVEVARRCLGRRDDLEFVLAGSGEQLEAVRGAIRSAGVGDRIHVPGFVDELAAVYRSADLFLSTSRYEGFGLAIAEAMAYGLPVVSTAVGGVRDVIGPAGVLVDTDEPDALATALLDLVGDRAERSRLSAAARVRATEELDVRVMARRFGEFYAELDRGSAA